jgi:hypothetical protein
MLFDDDRTDSPGNVGDLGIFDFVIVYLNRLWRAWLLDLGSDHWLQRRPPNFAFHGIVDMEDRIGNFERELPVCELSASTCYNIFDFRDLIPYRGGAASDGSRRSSALSRKAA